MPGNPLRTKTVIRFGSFEADLHTQELRKHGISLRLRGQSFQVLQMLLERQGELVTRDELRAALWPNDTFVDFDHGLHAAVSRLREVLGDSAESPNLIETLPRRGYRFIASIEGREPLRLPDREQVSAALADDAVVPPAHFRRPWLRYSIVSVAVVLVIGAASFLIHEKLRSPAPPTQRALTRVTFDKGLQFGATWSPDNRMIAYSSERGGKFDIWVQQISGGDPIQITKGPGHNWQPDWSPDGKFIAYRSEDGEGGLFIIPALGGAGLARKIVSAGFYPRWSPDGSRILFQTSQMRGENEFYVVSLDGKPPRKVVAELGPLNITMRSAAWHPDGKRITIWVLGPSPVPTFWTVPVLGGEGVESKIDPQVLRQLGEVPASPRDLSGDDGQFSWMPSAKAIIFEGTFRGVRNLWKMPVDRETLRANAIERLTTGSGLDTEFALSADGKRIAFTIKSDRVQAWVFPFDGTRGRLIGAGRSVTSPGVEAWEPNLSRDGRKLAFSILRAGKRELWEQSLQDGQERRIAPDDNYVRFHPRWSPDGRRLAYGRSSVGSGESQVVVWSAEGRFEEPLTPLSKRGLILYDWSPDGKQLLLSQQTSDNTIQISTLSAIPLSNSEPAPRTIAAKADHYLWEPRFSPDGRWVVFLDQSIHLVSTQSIIQVTSATGGPWIPVTEGKFWDDKPQWAADGKTLYFLSRQGGFYDVWGVRFNSAAGKVAGDRFRVTNFASSSLMIPNDMGGGDVALSISRDKLALSMSQVSGSIWVLNDVDQ
jgi:Tol biopolymer transport system component/DNA-binding winged helix-turn-helix (wHTH) protein